MDDKADLIIIVPVKGFISISWAGPHSIKSRDSDDLSS
jgi:hypothetical protein